MLILCSLILTCIQIQPLRSSRGQGYLAKSHLSIVYQYFQSTSPLLLLSQFHLQPPGKGGKKFRILRLSLGHKTKMAAMPIYSKNYF